MIYNKLVRDKIPSIIKADGKIAKYFHLKGEAFEKCLRDKLQEEAKELQFAQSKEDLVEEFADVLEVLYTLRNYHGITVEEIENARLHKNLERGSFQNQIFLESVQ